MEIRDLYNEKKELTGKTFIKGQQVPKGYYYLIVAIIIENSKGEFLIQKRVERKGGRWALTAGHPKSGETSLDGIIEETKEELGIDISREKIEFKKTITKNDQFFDIYYLKKDIPLEKIKIQEEEVEGVLWVTNEEVEQMMKEERFHEGHYRLFKEVINR